MKIEAISLETEKIFNYYRSKYRPNSFRFEDSWAYIIQACRKNGKVIQYKDNVVFTGEHSEDDSIILVNHFGNLFDLLKLVEEIKTKNKKVIYKNVNPYDLPVFLSNGFRLYNSDERWNNNSKYDDQTYPQQIINLEEFLLMSGINYKDLRKDMNFAKNRYDIVIEEYCPNIHKKQIEKLLFEQDKNISETYEAQRMYLDLTSNEDRFLTVYKINNQIRGFTSVDKISDSCCAANGLIYDFSLDRFSIMIYYSVAQIAKEKGFSFVNLQGSENRSLDIWKRKFNPIMSIRNTHLVFDN